MVPPELLNNTAVIMMQEDGRNEEAFKLLNEALKNCDQLLSEGNPDDKKLQALRVTLRFNLACCHEKSARIGEASDLLKSIV